MTFQMHWTSIKLLSSVKSVNRAAELNKVSCGLQFPSCMRIHSRAPLEERLVNLSSWTLSPVFCLNPLMLTFSYLNIHRDMPDSADTYLHRVGYKLLAINYPLNWFLDVSRPPKNVLSSLWRLPGRLAELERFCRKMVLQLHFVPSASDSDIPSEVGDCRCM